MIHEAFHCLLTARYYELKGAIWKTKLIFLSLIPNSSNDDALGFPCWLQDGPAALPKRQFLKSWEWDTKVNIFFFFLQIAPLSLIRCKCTIYCDDTIFFVQPAVPNPNIQSCCYARQRKSNTSSNWRSWNRRGVLPFVSNILCTKEKSKVGTIKPWSVFDQAGLCWANVLVDTKQVMNGQQKAQLHLHWIHYMIQNNTHILFVWTFFGDLTNVCVDYLSFYLAHLYPAGPSVSAWYFAHHIYMLDNGGAKKKKKKNIRHTLLNYTKRSTARASNYTKQLRTSSGELLQSLALIWIHKKLHPQC